MPDPLHHVRIHFTLDLPVQRYEPNDYLLHYNGSIVVSDGDDEAETAIGNIEVRRALFGLALNEGENWFDVLDAEDQEAADFAVLLADGASEYNARYADCPAVGLDLLMLHRLQIDEPFRGHGYGLAAVHTAISNLSAGCAVFATKPFPLQFSGYLTTDEQVAGDTAIKDAPRVRQPEFEVALAKLRKYFACLGMESDGEMMTLNLAQDLRPLREVLIQARRLDLDAEGTTAPVQ
jgi:GNAT superfamily N-acetyltransferase